MTLITATITALITALTWMAFLAICDWEQMSPGDHIADILGYMVAHSPSLVVNWFVCKYEPRGDFFGLVAHRAAWHSYH
tara:strand:- start:2254 stop:2490 length:237 start_codon:yes stop_codon:yes gene_type:complete